MAQKVLTISDGGSLTVDTNLITIDSTTITVDQVGSETYLLDIPYRFFSEDIYLKIKNKMTLLDNTLSLDAIRYKDLMRISFEYNFNEGDIFEVEVIDRNSDALIWKGKIFTTFQTDLQNYTI